MALVLDKLLLSKDNTALTELADSKKVEAGSGTLTVKEADLTMAKAGLRTLTDAEAVELRKTAVPPTYLKYCKSTFINTKLQATC